MKKKTSVTATRAKTYVARENAILSQKEVDIVGPYLHEVLFPDGMFDKEKVVADAKRRSSPLHSHFDWNNTTAAHAHRLDQAQKLITSFYIITPEGYKLPSVVSLKITRSPNRTYMATDLAVESPDLGRQILQQAIDGLLAWVRRYEMFARLPDFSGLIREINLIVQIGKDQTHGTKKKRN